MSFTLPPPPSIYFKTVITLIFLLLIVCIAITALFHYVIFPLIGI